MLITSQSPAHTYYSNYTYSQLYNLVLMILECCEDPRKHHAAIFDKYTDKRYKRASIFAETEMHRGFRILEIGTSSVSAWPMPGDDLSAWKIKP